MTPFVSYQVGLADCRAVWRSGRKKNRWVVVAFAIVLWASLLIGAVAVLVQNIDDEPRTAGLSGVVTGIVGTLWALALLGLREKRRQEEKIFEGSIVARGYIELRANDQAVEIRQAGIVSIYPWTSFVDMRSTSRFVLLYPATRQPLIIPRSALLDSPLEAMLDHHVAEGIPSRLGPSGK